MEKIYFFSLYFFVYGFLGWCTEVAFATWKSRTFVNRGFLNGPICPVYGIGVGGVVLLLAPFENQLLILYPASVILVTALEWLTGFLLEKLFHHRWWDYTGLPLNLGGHVCLLFSLIWGGACVLIVRLIHPLFHRVLALIPMPVGIVLLVILTVILIVDIAVTSANILRLNRSLDRLEEITAELHQISDRIGENIYQTTLAALEKQDLLLETLAEHPASEVPAEIREQIAQLSKKRRQFMETLPRVQTRLLKAFPHMQSNRHRTLLTELRKELRKTLKKSKRKLH